MKETTTIEPFGDPDNPDLQFFKEGKRLYQRMLDHIEKFAENPGSAHGVVNLSEALDKYDQLHTLYGEEASPFSHHMMGRLQERLGAMNYHYHELIPRDDLSPNYLLGRNVERAMQGIEAGIEEMQQCIEYAKQED